MTSHRFLQIFVASGIAFQASTAQTPPAVPLTVGDAVALVLSRNPALVESGHDIDAARARADQSRSGYLPSAEAEARSFRRRRYRRNGSGTSFRTALRRSRRTDRGNRAK